VYKISSKWNHGDAIKVEWNLGKRCNYDCSYCPSVIHDNTSKHAELSTMESVIDSLASIGRNIRLSLTGGEPSVNPNIEQLILYARINGMWLSMTSNGTRTATWYINQPVTQYVFSLHFEYEWERVIHTIIEVGKFRKSYVNVMVHHEKVAEAQHAMKQLRKYGIKHVARRIRWVENNDHDIFDDTNYDNEDLEWLLGYTSTIDPNVRVDEIKIYHANDIIKLGMNKFKGWECNAGIESLMINWDGDVHRATCRVGGSLGNIYDGTFLIPSTPIECTRNSCTCAADIPITKYAIS
jgi:MoaA/NifB/PqqE/SkfB family radical SAM enzyme